MHELEQSAWRYLLDVAVNSIVANNNNNDNIDGFVFGVCFSFANPLFAVICSLESFSSMFYQEQKRSIAF